MRSCRRRAVAMLPVAAVVLALTAPPAGANHSWNGYHWARAANPFKLKVGDNVSAAWRPSLRTAASDWGKSAVLDMAVVTGRSSPSHCPATLGRVEVCNAAYGHTGWLGLGQVWVSGKHITKGTVKLNDTYFHTAAYDSSAWRNFVTCQEMGHTIGLDHQDENPDNANLGTCMDYTNGPGTNQHPNSHDYAELALIYKHLDSSTTVNGATASSAGAPAEDLDGPLGWGRTVRSRADGRPVLFERDLGPGEAAYTWVTWGL